MTLHKNIEPMIKRVDVNEILTFRALIPYASRRWLIQLRQFMYTSYSKDTLQISPQCSRLSVPVVGLDKVSESLGLFVTVVVVVRIVWKTDVFHLVNTTTFVTSLIWSLL